MRDHLKEFIIFFIRIISGLFRWNNLRSCRFHPSCSEYSEQAFQRFGIIKASVLVINRLCRCHPFTTGGYDPLPCLPAGRRKTRLMDC